MHIECVWWFSSSWRLRYWHPHQQHQLRAPRRQPTMAFFCHLETTMKLPWWSMMPYAWLLKSTRCVLQPCVGYQVICRRCCRKRSLDGSDSSKRTGVSGEDGFHVQCHLSTITILQGIVYVFLYIWWYSMPTVHSNHLPGQVSNVSTRFNMFRIPHVEYQWSDMGRWMMDNCVIAAAVAEQSCWRKSIIEVKHPT